MDYLPIDFDIEKTIEQLDGVVWGEPDYDSWLVQTCYALGSKPLNQFDAGDLRIMIGQKDSLRYLMPLALNRLIDEPLVEGTYYPGDLLAAVLGCSAFLAEHPEYKAVLKEIVMSIGEIADDEILEIGKAIEQFLMDAD